MRPLHNFVVRPGSLDSGRILWRYNLIREAQQATVS